MTDRRLLCLPLLFALLAGCGKSPPEATEEHLADEAVAVAEPTADTREATEAAAEVAQPPADLEHLKYDQTTRTRSGEVAFNASQHVLKVTSGTHTAYYTTGAMAPKLAPADQQRLVDALAATFRYPAERTTSIDGTFVQELGGAGNELVTAAFHTADPVNAAAAVYDGRLERSPTPVYRVAVPMGEQQVVTYVVGLGAQRYRVVIAPEDGGSRVEVTQSYLDGVQPVEFMNGQGVLKAAPRADS